MRSDQYLLAEGYPAIRSELPDPKPAPVVRQSVAHEVVLHKGDKYWLKKLDDAEEVPTRWLRDEKAGDVARHTQTEHPTARIGIKAACIGPATLRECISQGYGTTLWLR